ncbi:uncharacterized protein [Rutidosis leptorrhynchoides]|uniref:uncharacterized protein n=1 Tax=Rutidosis leptorrhynchoides TaxID=125765 RepID=UPI003A98E137
MAWSETLLPELLDIIARKHMNYYEDYLSFSSVCKLWHSIAKQAATKVPYSNGLPSRFPSILLAEEKEDVEFRQLFFLSNNSIRKIRLPEAYGKFCVSSSGWLLTVGEDTATKLINPLSRETVDLPKLDTFPDFLEWDLGIRKLLFSDQSPIVVVLWGCSSRLGFCRLDDEGDGRKKLLVVIRELLDELTDDDSEDLDFWK